MTILIFSILALDILLFVWSMGNIPYKYYYPEINIPAFLITPSLIGLGIFYDVKRAFGIFEVPDKPAYLQKEFYFLFLLVYLGFFSTIALMIQYHKRLPKNEVYYQGITNPIKEYNPLAVLLYILLLIISVVGTLSFYFDPMRYI